MSISVYNNTKLAQYQGSLGFQTFNASQTQPTQVVQENLQNTTNTFNAAESSKTSEVKTDDKKKQQKKVFDQVKETTGQIKKIIVSQIRDIITLNNILKNSLVYRWLGNFRRYVIEAVPVFENFIVDIIDGSYNKILSYTKFGSIIQDNEILNLLKQFRSNIINKFPNVNLTKAIIQRVKQIKSASHFPTKTMESLESIIKNLEPFSARNPTAYSPLLTNLVNKVSQLEFSTNALESEKVLKEIDILINNPTNKNIISNLNATRQFDDTGKLIFKSNPTDIKNLNNLSNSIKNESKILAPMSKTIKLLGDNPTLTRQMAVKSFNFLAKAIKSLQIFKTLIPLADFITSQTGNSVFKYLDVLSSSVDFFQWIVELNNNTAKLDFSANVIDNKEQYKKNIYFVISAAKFLTSILQFVPGINAFVLPIDTLLGLLQNDQIMDKLIDTGVSLGVASAGLGWGGAEKIKELEKISNQTFGSAPTDPDAKVVYDWVLSQNPIGKLYSIILKNKTTISTQNALELADNAINNFDKNAPSDLIKKSNSKTFFGQKSWLRDINDTRFQMLRNSLLGYFTQAIKSANQIYIDDIKNNQPNLKKANSSYNNRRYTICPSI